MLIINKRKYVVANDGGVRLIARNSYDNAGLLAESSLRDGGSFIPVPVDRPSLGSALSLDSALALPTEPFGPRFPLPADNSETFTYDLNANIVGITRKGAVNGLKYDTIDDIEMEYFGNRLTTLRDKADDVFMESSMDVPSGAYGGRDFGYNAAGCVTRDVSRGIAHMTYHASGLPDMIGSMTSDCVTYDYTTSGVKLDETVWNGSRITRRGYAGPVETVDGRVVRVNVAQGYFDSLGVLHAYIPDIQGNIVGVYEAKEGVTELEQFNEYYAYGGITADSRGQDRNRRKYTAKELITDLGINSYDFSARRQYPALGRFDAPDSKAADYKWLSPYAFCGGDPINNIDPTGNDYELIIDDENKTMTVSAVYFACTPDLKSLNKAIDFWNNQSGKHSIGGYIINFDLQAVEVSEYNEYDASEQEAKDNHRKSFADSAAKEYNKTSELKNGNSYIVHSGLAKHLAGEASNSKIEISRQRAHKTTGAHEIGHTLGMLHYPEGLMTESADSYRSYKLFDKNIIDMVGPVIRPPLIKDKERKKAGVGHLKVINKTIERLYLLNYYRIKK